MPEPVVTRLFTPDLEAAFVRRPNRFIIEADTGTDLVRVHCPNPGRMEEFLTPGRVSALVDIRAASIITKEDGFTVLADPDIPIDLQALPAAEENTGAYLLVLHLAEEETLAIGSLGTLRFLPGWYVYAGSGKKNLSQRIARHLRKKKTLRWHIDYLTSSAGSVKAYPIYTFRDLECPLAANVARIADASIPGFGCSDCRCRSHLFYFPENPVRTEAFQEVVLLYRHRESIPQ